MIQGFNFERIPKIIFGEGVFAGLPKMIRERGTSALIITGAGSYRSSGKWDGFVSALKEKGVAFEHAIVSGEPTPEAVDAIVAENRERKIDVVVAWGGGSAVDAGKAVSAMLKHEGPVTDYLEQVGTKQPTGAKVPFIAAPTTAGTGSEATKNAVLSRVGENGFKKSLRHDDFVPDVALMDPELMISCPATVTASCGMDAFTQLLESYVSTAASPMTDALAFSGLEFIRDCLVPACSFAACDIDVRSGMAYAALMSGITLANAGLGLVHGFAASAGGFFDIPHGVVCGTLVGAVTEETIKQLLENAPESPALVKYAKAGAMLAQEPSADIETGCGLLVATINEWVESLRIPRLGAYGVAESDFDRIIGGTGNKFNPAKIDEAGMRKILKKRL